ncbi:hypothetical protein KFK09_013861 [Dendrobium nobile]|uniref:Transmembrane protein n=1 Tax=Dendrobium nobile TaxID=94219 RepID=A0A8T3B8F7_DENNO|nr:hypothetical protein KFK09_013861 [Dendrobium nobile]
MATMLFFVRYFLCCSVLVVMAMHLAVDGRAINAGLSSEAVQLENRRGKEEGLRPLDSAGTSLKGDLVGWEMRCSLDMFFIWYASFLVFGLIWVCWWGFGFIGAGCAAVFGLAVRFLLPWPWLFGFCCCTLAFLVLLALAVRIFLFMLPGFFGFPGLDVRFLLMSLGFLYFSGGFYRAFNALFYFPF